MLGREYTYSTVEDIRDTLLRRAGDDTDSNFEFLSEESIIKEMDDLQRKVWDAPYSLTDIGGFIIHPNMKGWSFSEDERKVDTTAKTTLSADVAAGASSITVADASNFPNATQGIIIKDSNGAWEVAKYTTSDLSTSISGITELNSPWDSGDDVYRAYPLPSDFGKMKNDIMINDAPYTQVGSDPKGNHFATYEGLLWMPDDIGTVSFTYEYTIKMNVIDDIEDTLQTPKEFDFFYVNYLLGIYAMLNGNPEGDKNSFFKEAHGILSARMGYDVKSSNRRINLLRRPPHSPSGQTNPNPDFTITG